MLKKVIMTILVTAITSAVAKPVISYFKIVQQAETMANEIRNVK